MLWATKIFGFMAKHYQAIAIVLIVISLLGFGYYIKSIMAENKALKVEMQTKDARINEIKNELDNITSSVKEQEKNLNQLNIDMNKAATEAKEAAVIFNKHNLHELSAKKPGLIEKRVNKASQEVILAMQQDTETFYKEVTSK